MPYLTRFALLQASARLPFLWHSFFPYIGMKMLFMTYFLFLAACQDSASDPAAGVKKTDSTTARVVVQKDTTTLGGDWYLVPVLASDTATGEVPEVAFDLKKTTFSGNTGCNKMGGPFWYSDKDSSLSFSDKIITTKMFCPGYDEKAFVTSLGHTNHYRLKNGMLILMADNTELSKWTRNPPKLPKTGKA